MARGQKRLTARQVQTAKPGRYADGDGLWLDVSASGRRNFVYRFTLGGKVREMGLRTAVLAEARDRRDACRSQVKAGIDPIAARRALAAQKPIPLFHEAADAFIASKAAEWRNARHAKEWHRTLTEHAAPLMGMRVDEIDTAAVLAALGPLWQKLPATASRVRARIETILDAAAAQGQRDRGYNPARWRGHLKHLLPRRAKLSVKRHAALPYDDVPAFVARLRETESVTGPAIEFLVLTAARAGEVFGMTWSEIDAEKALWTIPAERMKAARSHTVPLSPRALEIVERQREVASSHYVFPGRMGGFRSSNDFATFFDACAISSSDINSWSSSGSSIQGAYCPFHCVI